LPHDPANRGVCGARAGVFRSAIALRAVGLPNGDPLIKRRKIMATKKAKKSKRLEKGKKLEAKKPLKGGYLPYVPQQPMIGGY
jgi:hypothetical protein